jgi:hypothetical protein
MLYALHYEKHTNNDIVGLVDALKQRGVPEHLTKVSNSVTFSVVLSFCYPNIYPLHSELTYSFL